MTTDTFQPETPHDEAADDPATDAGSEQDLSGRSVDELAAELGTLAARIAASTCRFLVLLGEFDARDGWTASAGVTSSTHWLSWQCGVAAVTAREQVRIARAMRDLPLTTAEFGAGRLSYSKVRAITRVATADTERELVDVARAGTADQVERFCAGVRAAAGSLEEVNARHERGSLSHRTLTDGSVSVSTRCSPEEGAVIVDALYRAQEYLKQTAAADEDTGYSMLDALVLICEQSEIGPQLASVDAETAAETRSSTSHSRGSRRAETVLHVTLAELAATPVVGGDAPARAHGGPHSLIGARLESGAALHPETARRIACDAGLVTHLHADGISPPGDWVRPNPRPGRTVDLGRRRRLPSSALFRALWDRDQGCVFPGCGRRRYLHGHHLVHWAAGGPTNLDNMALLCGEHHRRLHEGGFEMWRRRSGTIWVTDPGGATVAKREFFDGVADPDSVSDPAGDDSAGPLTATDGGPLHLDYAVSTVASIWALRRDRAARQRTSANESA